MNFFKHYTNGHESTAMTHIIQEWGLAGYARYFILMEMGVDKIHKGRDRELTKDDCKFRIHATLLRQKLHLRASGVEEFLNSCATQDLLLFSKVEQEFHFYVPKILEFFDRDSKRARHARATARPKEGEEEGDIDKEVEEESAGQPIFKTDPKTEEVLSNVPRDIQASWLAMYGDRVWIAKRLQKFVSWCLQKPSRMNQDWPVFFGGKLHEDFEAEPPKKRRPVTSEPQIDGCCAREDYDSAASMPLPSPETAAEANAKISALLGRQLTIVKTEGV